MMNTVGVRKVSPILKVVVMPNALISHGRKSLISGMQLGLVQVYIYLSLSLTNFNTFDWISSPLNKKIYLEFCFGLSHDWQCWKTWCLMSMIEKLISLTNQLQVKKCFFFQKDEFWFFIPLFKGWQQFWLCNDLDSFILNYLVDSKGVLSCMWLGLAN